EKQKAAIQAVLQSAKPLADRLYGLGSELMAVSDTVKDGDPKATKIRGVCKEYSERCATAAESLTKAAETARDLLGKTIGHSAVPATDDAATALRLSLNN